MIWIFYVGKIYRRPKHDISSPINSLTQKDPQDSSSLFSSSLHSSLALLTMRRKGDAWGLHKTEQKEQKAQPCAFLYGLREG